MPLRKIGFAKQAANGGRKLGRGLSGRREGGAGWASSVYTFRIWILGKRRQKKSPSPLPGESTVNPPDLSFPELGRFGVLFGLLWLPVFIAG